MNIFDSDCVSSLGEKLLIARMCKAFGSVCPQTPYGSGDDCALIERNSLQKHLYTTVDSLIYGKHFDSSTSALLAGEKLLKRNISDIASMGAHPVNAVIAAVISGDVSVSWLEEFAVGVKNVAEKFNTKIIGGDFADSGVEKFFSMSLTLLGESEYQPLLRNKAIEGDCIYCTGKLGFSFESNRHLTFTPRVAEGEFLAKYNTKNMARITSCTDISDGLACDIDNILSPSTKAVLDFIPLFEYNGITSVEHALCDGEDYELLFSASGNAQALSDFEQTYEDVFGCKLYRLGNVQKKEPSSESSLWLNFDGKPTPFSASGFEHFA
ncbi:MAG: thiamine-monophosphate kinase [Verrucomicrobiaceae bacterium]|nr:thiamine-monophosphate kinase [Verrucomicrobiaceae bacterium]